MRLENGNVILGERVILLTELECFGEGMLVAKIGDTYIPEEDCTAEEKEVFNAYRAFYGKLTYTINRLKLNLAGNGLDDEIELEGSSSAETLFKIWLDAEGIKYSEIQEDGISKFPPMEGTLLLEGIVRKGVVTVNGGVLYGNESAG